MANELTKAGVVVYRRESSGEIRVLLITAKTVDAWIPPIGKIDPGEDAEDAAVRETYEEAGVEVALKRSLGDLVWSDPKGEQSARFFLGQYVSDLDWPEQGVRRRQWYSVSEACEKVFEPFLPMIEAAAEALTDGPSKR